MKTNEYKKGKIVYIKLGDNVIKKFDYSDKFLQSYLGGRGFNSILMYWSKHRIPPHAYHPDNLLLVSAGLLSGTEFPSSGRTTVSVLRSPVTQRFGDGNLGGHFGPALRQAGVDALIIDGKADYPAYIYITKDGIEVRSADRFWTCGIQTTDLMLRFTHGEDIKPLVIGQAGVNKVFSAVPACENRVPGGGGSGAVMGSKNLKGIVVDYDPSPGVVLPAKDPIEFCNSCDEATKKIENHPVFNTFSKYGTTSLVEIHSGMGYFPTRNWTSKAFTGWKKISGRAFEKFWKRKYPEYDKRLETIRDQLGCKNCPVVCSNPFKVEYETINCLGAKLGIDNPAVIQNLNTKHMNDAGLDVIQTTSIISALMEMYQDGVSDYKIEWGDDLEVDLFILELYTPRIDHSRARTPARHFRKGFLGGIPHVYNGSQPKDKVTWKSLMMRYYPNVKGMGLSGVVPSDKNKGVALAVATSSRGGDHLRSLPTLATYADWYLGKKGFRKFLQILQMPLEALDVMKGEASILVKDLYSTYTTLFGVPKPIVETWKSLGFLLNPQQLRGWGHMIKFTQEMYALTDAVGVCRFTSPWRFGIGPQLIAKACYFLTGLPVRWNQLLRVGERINAVEKELSWQYDQHPMDSIPRRFIDDRNGLKGIDFETMKAEYYERCRYDVLGRPRPGTVYLIIQNTTERVDDDLHKTLLCAGPHPNPGDC